MMTNKQPNATCSGDREVEALALVAWAWAGWKDRLAMTSAFGLSGVALCHIVARIAPQVPILFVDTGFHFPEVLETRDRIIRRYGLDVRTIYPEPVPMTLSSGVEVKILPAPMTDECCAQRKVAPMRAALEALGPKVLLSARGRFQAVTRQSLELVEWERKPMRINPLARWTQADVEGFVQAHEIPYNPMYDQGYPSVGCVPCTRAVEQGEDIRAGRWDGLGKVECGLWR